MSSSSFDAGILKEAKMTDQPVVQHFSDVLCVWAYVAHARLEHIAKRYGNRIALDIRFCSVFPDARNKIAANWRDRGGAKAYAEHVRSIVNSFGHVEIHPDVWSVVQPATSTSAHLFLKAVEVVENDIGESSRPLRERLIHRAAWAFRCAFFKEAKDISNWSVQSDVAEKAGLDVKSIEKALGTGEAAARLDADMSLCKQLNILGSPTFAMNDGRQILYGNVGAHLIEANVEELFRVRHGEEASWC